MNLDLKEIGLTLIIGVLCILGAEAILYEYFGRRGLGLYRSLLSRTRSKTIHKNETGMADEQSERVGAVSLRAVVIVGIAFGIGLLAENLSYHHVDNIPTPLRLPAWTNSVPGLGSKISLPSKEESRIRTLIRNFQTDEPEIDSLALDLADNHAFAEVYGEKTGAKFDRWIVRIRECNLKVKECELHGTARNKCYEKNNDKCQFFDEADLGVHSREELEDAIYGLYYHSKNTDYLQQNYYDELHRIETRRDFSRSVALIASFYLLMAWAVAIPRMARAFMATESDGAKTTFLKRLLVGFFSLFRKAFWKGLPKRFRNVLRSVNTRIATIWLVLFVISFLGMWAYEKESDEFNKRAFGYYRSELVRQRNRNLTWNGGTGN